MVRALAGDSTITSRVPSPDFVARLPPARFDAARAVLLPAPSAGVAAAVPLVAPLRGGTLVQTSHPRHGPPRWAPCWPHLIRGCATLSLHSNPHCGPRCSPPGASSAIRQVRHLIGQCTGGQPARSGFLTTTD